MGAVEARTSLSVDLDEKAIDQRSRRIRPPASDPLARGSVSRRSLALLRMPILPASVLLAGMLRLGEPRAGAVARERGSLFRVRPACVNLSSMTSAHPSSVCFPDAKWADSRRPF